MQFSGLDCAPLFFGAWIALRSSSGPGLRSAMNLVCKICRLRIRTSTGRPTQRTHATSHGRGIQVGHLSLCFLLSSVPLLSDCVS